MEYGLVLVWLVTYLALAALGVPVAAALFPRFADRGAGVALALSTAVLAVVGYWVGRVAFGWPAVLAGLAVLALASWLSLRRGVEVDWRGYTDAALVFTIAFALLIGVRALDPAAWPGGGEKFLDFGLLASLLRGNSLPPQDFWFAGETVQYYYGGHMLAALLARLTGTSATYAYNLALAGFYATLVSTAFGLAGALGAARGYSRRAPGALAAFFVGIASNLHTPFALAVWLLPSRVDSLLAGWSGVEPQGLANGPGEFNYWFASRVIEGTINEFPFFAWLNGDLHAHMMVTPYVLLAAALLFAYWRTPPGRVRRRRLLVFGALPPLAGIVAVTSTWSFPTVAGLTALTLALAPASPVDLLPGPLARPLGSERAGGTDPAGVDPDRTDPDRPGVTDADRWLGEAGRAALALALAGLVAGLGVLAALPFFLGPASGRAVGLLPDRSGMGALLVVHGAFLLVSVAYLLARSRLDRDDRVDVVLAAVVVLGLAWWLDVAAVGLFVPLVVGGWWLLRTGRVGFEAVLVVGVAGLLTLVEFAFVSEQAGPGRMNTVFKVYMQVWVLWATAAGAMLAGLVDGGAAVAAVRDLKVRLGRLGRTGPDRPAQADGAGGPPAAASGPDRSGGRSARAGRDAAGALVAALLVVSLSLYAGFALAGEVAAGRDDPGLDARAYLHDYHPDEADAIDWLAGVEGQPHLASAPGTDIYRWVNGPSSLTGVPTVAGWIHEVGYRGPEPYFDRVEDVEILFTGDRRSRAAIVEKYDVEYVYVGPIENERYGEPEFRGEPGFEVAYADENVTIYAVDSSALG